MAKTSKSEFLAQVAKLYALGNVSDHETNPNKEWTKSSMAAVVCGALDDMLHKLEADGVLTAAERQTFYDTL